LPLFYVPTRFNWFFVLALIHTPFIESIWVFIHISNQDIICFVLLFLPGTCIYYFFIPGKCYPLGVRWWRMLAYRKVHVFFHICTEINIKVWISS
jgi:hypothetical protein